MLQSTRKELAERLVSIQTEYERAVTMAQWDTAEDLRKQIQNLSDALNLANEDTD